jgi:hypothetical protein
MSKQNLKTSKAQYLLNCDNINKYNYTSVHSMPVVEKITFQILIKDFLNASDFLNKKEVNNSIQLKAVIFFYLIFSFFPQISFQNLKITKSLKNRQDGDFIITLNLNDKNKIHSLLSDLFIDNGCVFNTEGAVSLTKSFCLNTQSNKKIFSYNIKIEGHRFFDINEFFNVKIQNIALSKLKINANLLYSNLLPDKDVSLLIRNTSFYS